MLNHLKIQRRKIITVAHDYHQNSIKRQRLSDIRLPGGKLFKQSKKLTSGHMLQVAIIGHNYPLGKFAADI